MKSLFNTAVSLLAACLISSVALAEPVSESKLPRVTLTTNTLMMLGYIGKGSVQLEFRPTQRVSLGLISHNTRFSQDMDLTLGLVAKYHLEAISPKTHDYIEINLVPEFAQLERLSSFMVNSFYGFEQSITSYAILRTSAGLGVHWREASEEYYYWSGYENTPAFVELVPVLDISLGIAF